MNITIFALGTRGDIQPDLALAVGLQHAGHHVTLVAPYNFASWIRSYGVTAHPVRFSLQEFMQKPEVKAALRSHNILRQMRMMRDEMGSGIMEALEEFWQASQDADFVIQTSSAHGAVDIARERNIPMAFVFLQPLAPPTRAFPSFLLPFRFSLGGHYNYLTHVLIWRAGWPAVGGPLNRWRAARFNLPPWRSATEMFNARRGFGTPWLYAFSPGVVPKPAEWDEHHHVTGYWFLDPPPDWQPPPELERFLEDGPPPVYVGFGSMSHEDLERQTRLALRTLELAGQRGVLSTGWGGITRLPASPTVFYVDDVPHSWLFPRMAAVVHHGGAGTTAESLRAGVPSIVSPFVVDQYAWAEQVARLGVGVRAAPIKKLTAEKLAEAIRSTVHDTALRARASGLGEQIRAENGIACAVDVIQRHADEWSQRLEAKP